MDSLQVTARMNMIGTMPSRTSSLMICPAPARMPSLETWIYIARTAGGDRGDRNPRGLAIARAFKCQIQSARHAVPEQQPSINGGLAYVCRRSRQSAAQLEGRAVSMDGRRFGLRPCQPQQLGSDCGYHEKPALAVLRQKCCHLQVSGGS